MANKLPKLFFDHFNNTSFVAEKDGRMVGFLIGFLSQTASDEGYVHFIGIDPDYRKQSVGTRLYDVFFEAMKKEGRTKVRAITSPVNKTSVAYHTKMGFAIVEGDKEVDGVSVFADYDGPNEARVLFVKTL